MIAHPDAYFGPILLNYYHRKIVSTTLSAVAVDKITSTTARFEPANIYSQKKSF